MCDLGQYGIHYGINYDVATTTTGGGGKSLGGHNLAREFAQRYFGPTEKPNQSKIFLLFKIIDATPLAIQRRIFMQLSFKITMASQSIVGIRWGIFHRIKSPTALNFRLLAPGRRPVEINFDIIKNTASIAKLSLSVSSKLKSIIQSNFKVTETVIPSKVLEEAKKKINPDVVDAFILDDLEDE